MNPSQNAYKRAGVDVEKGDRFVHGLKDKVQSTLNANCLSAIGGFAALYDMSNHNLKEPVLLSATDGIGTKLKLGLTYNQIETLGIDCVAMCVNDILVHGGKPLFFLDYLATSKLDLTQANKIIEGIVAGCNLAECALIGGETAEMPGLYQNNDFDLAGFAIGLADKSNLLPQNLAVGDVIIGIPSSGFHSNGYSLIRKIIDEHQIDLHKPAPFCHHDIPLKEYLLKPTEIYIKSIYPLITEKLVKGLAHITGGGISGNLSRIIPPSLQAHLSKSAINLPPLFQWLQNLAQLDFTDMESTFNCGIGMIMIIKEAHLHHIQARLQQAMVIGTLKACDTTTEQRVVYDE